MSELVAVDIGGTHARFAIAKLAAGRVGALGEACTLKTADHPTFEDAWRAYAAGLGRPLPTAAAIAVAAPTQGAVVKLTNNPWVIRPESISQEFGLSRFTLVNDFVAIGHAVAQLAESHFRHVCGPERPLPAKGVIGIVGPGTGLGVAQLFRTGEGHHVIETEGGHVDFAPLDGFEDRMLAELRGTYGRVSVERVVSGPGLTNICRALAAVEGRELRYQDEKDLWAAALEGTDSLASSALDRFCLTLGSVAGDVALVQGAQAVVIAGGIGLRLADRLPGSGFRERFLAKGRFRQMMESMTVKVVTHQQPGLFGAAAAFAAEHQV